MLSRTVPAFAAAAAVALMPVARSAEPPLDVTSADNAFGFRLLEALQGAHPEANGVISPVSAALDLSMVLNAASGQTRQEMLSALALTGSDLDVINAANSRLIAVLRTPVQDVALSVADSLWVNSRRGQLRADYVTQMQSSYTAEIQGLDFERPGTVTRINDWASQATDGKISSVLDHLDSAELAVLLDAVYVKGGWSHPFDPAHTHQRDFTLAGGSVEQVPRMMQTGRFDYVETPHLQAIRLPFGQGDLVMDVLLPSGSSSLTSLLTSLTTRTWASWSAQYSPREGTVELPRFELKSRYRLNEALQRLGMVRAFQPGGAQLAGMFMPEAGHRAAARFSISSVQQATYLKVDEAGAQAAAVTSIGVRSAAVVRAPPPFHLVIDRPFFCAIEDRRSGALLFIGAIHDPATNANVPR